MALRARRQGSHRHAPSSGPLHGASVLEESDPPFTDQTGTKKRPAIVVSSDAYRRQRPDVVVMAVTSQLLRPAGAVGEVLITEWQKAGLPKASLIGQRSTIEADLLHPSARSYHRRPSGVPDHLGSEVRATFKTTTVSCV
jgi:mRNA-degrading endonuclease toxin of MazEF toxin-antitoxin module